MYNIRVVAVYGGGGKYEMSRALKETAPELVIATPGRFIEMVRAAQCWGGAVCACMKCALHVLCAVCVGDVAARWILAE